MTAREKIYAVIEPKTGKSKLAITYDFVQMAVILVSLVPLTFKSITVALYVIDKITVGVFLLDYFLRLLTADIHMKKGAKSFLLYPFTPLALVDLVSILPSFVLLHSGLGILKVLRLIRVIRVFRVFKIFRYSKSIERMWHVFSREKYPLLTVGGLAVAYVFITALILFNVEPDTFDTFFDALYWSTMTLTTVGYGDIAPVSVIGRIFSMLSSFIGIAIIALPSGIIIDGYMRELQREKQALDIYEISKKSEEEKTKS